MKGELPEGWAEVLLKNITKVEWGNTRTTKKSYVAKGFPAFSAAGQDGFLSHYEWEGPAVILSAIGARCGKCFFADGKWTAIKNTIVIQGDPTLVDHKLLYFSLNDEKRWAISGTGQPFITMGSAQETMFLLPPLNEQRRIVAKLEELLGKVNSCQERLAKIPVILKRFRQAVLAAGCSGRLTADWREKNIECAPAITTIQRLRTPDPEPHLDIFENHSDCQIPQTWSWVRLGKLGRIVGGGTPSKNEPLFWNGTIPWVSPKDMKRDRIDDSEDHITKRGLQYSRLSIVQAGSILFVVRGMILNHTLPTAITNRSVTLNQDMKALIPEDRRMGEYLFLASKHVARSILFEVKEATHGTRRIETPVLRNWAIPVPPLAEQQEIARRVEALFALSDQIETRYARAQAQVDKMTPSLLAKAFRGELVPQDPNDEPAAVLLERIRAQRETGKPRTAGGRKASRR